MTTVELANLALYKLGITKGITATTDASKEATTVAAHYDHVLRYCLTRYPWSFATKYAELLLVRGPLWNSDPDVLTNVQAWSATPTYAVGDVVRQSSVNYYCILASTNNQPPNTTYWSTSEDDAPDYANGDWRYGYRWPSDCLYARRLVNDGVGRKFDESPYPWRKGRDNNGLLLFTNQDDAVLEYTVMDCDALYADDPFIDFFTWRLAGACAASLAKNGLTLRECLSYAELAFLTATTDDARQQQQEKPGDAEWINGR